MKHHFLRAAGVTSIALVGIFVSSWTNSATRVHANSQDGESRVQIGFRVAPVRLNLKHKDADLVGYGSYLVNVASDCNGCHTAEPASEFLQTGNPYFGVHPARVNTATYLGGGQDFGALIPGSAHIISRNLTPDKTGRPEGGHTYQEFVEIMKHGKDFDNLHPTCADAAGEDCIPKPFDGSLLQIMPWPGYRHMSEEDLRAIYEYLSAIPCIAGPPAPSPLHNECY
jgi:hypothetical protein